MSDLPEAMYWSLISDGCIRCELCPNHCNIKESQTGVCGVRENAKKVLYVRNYGQISSIALDPIEKKPLYMFHPGKKIVSVGSVGCNFHCPFCQNSEISLEFRNLKRQPEYISPETLKEIALLAVSDGNIGVAYTYNEPFVSYEYLFDSVKLIREAGLMNVLVTNGYINEAPLVELLPYIDAMNIDIKGYNGGTYNRVGGTLESIQNTIKLVKSECHVEVTTLVIPGENEEDVEDIAKWLSDIDRDIPYHLSRFFPRYRYSDKEPTPRETMYDLYEAAKKHLNNVFIGNMG